MVKRKWSKEEIEEYRNTHGVFFYCNNEDSNLFVPKGIGIGWTVNWANPNSWVFALAIIGVIVVSLYFSSKK